MSHAVAKPKTATGGVVEFVIAPSDQGITGNLFTVSVASATLGFSVQTADVTADSDVNAVYTHNEMTRGTFQVTGYALGSSSFDIGVYNLQSTSNGPLTGPSGTVGGGSTQTYNIKFNWANGKSVYGIALIEQIQMSYSRSSSFVGVNITGRFTSTDMSDVLVVG
tara:strand:- start:523 stop:1017 length:495 start_codon:yes stop_codon:yes gene_type:complete